MSALETEGRTMEQGSDFFENMGRAILKRMHQHYIRESLDDTEFIPFVKAVIQGVKDRLAATRCAEEEQENIGRALKQYCKELYVREWVKNLEKGETTSEAREKGEKHFEYLFKHGRPPSWQ